jgi:hypothetical protein
MASSSAMRTKCGANLMSNFRFTDLICQGPPELWRLSKTQSTENTDDKEARLTLRHRFMPKVPVEFAGPSYFGGKDNSLVICAAKGRFLHLLPLPTKLIIHCSWRYLYLGPRVCSASSSCSSTYLRWRSHLSRLEQRCWRFFLHVRYRYP